MVDEQLINDLVIDLRSKHDGRHLEALTCALIEELEHQVIERTITDFHVKGQFCNNYGIHWTHSNWVCS